MKETFYVFEINGDEVKIKVMKTVQNKVIVPIFKNINGEVLNLTCIVEESEFLQDIGSLLPEYIGEDYFNKIMESLFKTIQNYINKFGKLLTPDMELFIGETILVMCGISNTIGIPEPSEQDKVQIFELLKTRILSAMPENN